MNIRPNCNWLLYLLFAFCAVLSALAAEPTLKPMAYVVEDTEADGYKNPTDEVSIIQPHFLVVAIPKPVIGTQYEAHYSVKDDSGADVDVGTFSYKATVSPQFTWHKITPDYKKHKSGKWTIKVSGTGIGKLTVDYTVLPPTPSEQLDLAKYEQAREAVFRAFAEYWIGITNHYGARSNEVFFYTAPSQNLLLRDAAELLGIGGISYQATKNSVSDADRLNGITYQGTGTFGFNAFRQYRSKRGWTKWMDNSGDLTFFDKIMGAKLTTDFFGSIPQEFQNGYGYNFSFEEKDGHWRVKEEGGSLFINGKLVLPEKIHIQRPSFAQTRQLIDTGQDPRRNDKAEGDEIKASPEQIELEIRTTMRLLRGDAL